MDDRELLAALEGLGLGRENHRAILLLPLIEVAWADGRIQRGERYRLAVIAKRYGIPTTDAWLNRWLTRKPSKKVFLAAHTALLALMSRGIGDPGPAAPEAPPGEESPLAFPASLERLLDLCLEVAEAAGGLFGLAFTVTREERDCIEQIAQSLQLGPALPEPVVSAWKNARDRKHRAEQPTSLRAPRRNGPRYGILDQTTVHLPEAERTPGITAVPLAAEVVDEPTDPFDGWLAKTGRKRAIRSALSTGSSLGEPFAHTPLAEVTNAVKRAGDRRVEANPAEPIRVAVGPRTSAQKPPKAPPPPPVVRPRASTAAGRPPEEDPTLPFFDKVNVGTYAIDPGRDDEAG